MAKAMTKMDAVAQLLEKDGLPQVARGLLRRNQQFLDDTEALALRVGELPEPVWIGDIMGDFDIQFVGTRNAINRQVKMQGYDRLIAMAQSLPAVAERIPWDAVLFDLFGEVLQMPEVAVFFAPQQGQQGDPQQEVIKNLMLEAAASQAGAQGQNVPDQAAPVGAEQAAGAPIEPQ
jgi:hypothetical protein